jgi:hypothetical protein
VDYYPAEGWVWTNGKMGKQVLEGSFKGDIRSIFTPPKTILVDCRGHVGTMGFLGFYLKWYSFFLGYTLVAKFVYWSP